MRNNNKQITMYEDFIVNNIMNPVEIKIKYHSNDIPKITKIDKGDWIDLYAAENVFIERYHTKLISLGISVQLPKGYEAHLLPRSSTFKTWGIIMSNNMGVIDESYCGEDDIWKFPALSLSSMRINHTKIYEITGEDYRLEPIKHGSLILKGDKICQFRIMRKQNVIITEVDHLNNPSRGGFGSTGKN